MEIVEKYIDIITLANKMAKEYSGKLSETVEWKHIDGSEFRVVSSKLVKYLNWYFILTEHHGNFVYHKTDLRSISSYEDMQALESNLD